MTQTKDSTSTRPYLIRALYEWCTDNGLTPFIAVQVNEHVRVPIEFVKDGEIVLNISFDATSALNIGNDCIEFKGRFGGVARDIVVPVERVLAIYARENGQGMAFPMVPAVSEESVRLVDAKTSELAPVTAANPESGEPGVKPPAGSGRPSLTRVK